MHRGRELDKGLEHRSLELETEFESARARLEQQLAEAHERVASLEAEVAMREAEIAELPAVPAGRWDSAQSHLVFFQGKEGYELHERSGPPPSEGSSVAVIMDQASYVFPSGEPGRLSAQASSELVTMLNWAKNPRVKKLNMAFVLVDAKP